MAQVTVYAGKVPYTATTAAKANTLAAKSFLSQGTPSPSVGIKAASPTTNVSRPPTTLPESQKAPTQPTYPGTVGAQIKAKDQAAAAPTYPGLVTSLANQQNTPYNQGTQNAMNSLQNNAQTNLGTSGPAYSDYQTKVNELQGLKSGIASQEGAIESQPIPLNFQQGREQALARQYASQLDAAQQSVVQAQQGIGYQLQGGQLQQSNLTNAGNLGVAGQGQAQNALSAAAGYAQPQLGSIGQVPFNPLDQGQGAVLGSTQPGGLNAAGNLLGQFQGAQATGAAPGQAQASNIQTSGTTPTNTAAAGYSTAAQAYTNMQGINTSAEGQIKQVQDVLNSTGLNQGVPDYNKAINTLFGRLGSTGVTQLTTAVTELQNMYSQLLSSGGTTPSGSEAQALQLLSPNSSAAQIAASIQQLQAAAQNRLTGQYGQLQTYYNNLNSGNQAPSTNTESGSTATSAGGYHFVKDASGKWVVQ